MSLFAAVATLLPVGMMASSAHADLTLAAGNSNWCPTDTTTMTGSEAMGLVSSILYNADQKSFWANDVVNDQHSMPNTAKAINAQQYYNNGFFGQGVDVALIDTGVAPVQGLDNGNVIHGPDLSFESQSPMAHLDTFGHGTHLAGIIAGADVAPNRYVAAGTPESYGAWTNAQNFTGIAPASRVISVKAADSQGSVDVTQMIAAIDWVTQHKDDMGLHIRVLNLSYGVNTAAFDNNKTDALSFAVEQAWNAGIVVVASTGNDGRGQQGSRPGLASPAFNSDVIAVGSYDAATGTPTDFSQLGGNITRTPDFVTPGQSILSLHASGASMDDEIASDCFETVKGDPAHGVAPKAWTMPVVGDNGRFVRGSGTSQSAAVASGAVALMLSRYPWMTPDYVKKVLMLSAHSVKGGSQGISGQGLLDLAAAWKTFPQSTQQHADPVGGASLDAARAGQYLTDGTTQQHELIAGACTPGSPNNVKYPYACITTVVNLSGNKDIFGETVDLAALQAAEKKRSAWVKNADGTESWMGSNLKIGGSWVLDPNTLFSWGTVSWQGTSWTGRRWSANDWSGRRWSGRRWSGRRWTDGSWSGRRWSDHVWQDGAWS